MPFRDVGERLDPIADAIDWIERMTAGRSFTDYLQDHPLRDAVERNIERLSEASRHLPDHLKNKHPRIPWIDIASIGNRLRHAYDAINDAIIWPVIEFDLLDLKVAIEAMRRELDEAEGG